MESHLFNSFTSSSPPSLNTELTQLYDALPEDYKKLFIKLYKYLWDVVLPYSIYRKPGGLIYYYYALDAIRDKYSLTFGQLALLTFLYYATRSGSKYIHSDVVYLGLSGSSYALNTKRRNLVHLRHKGFILRSRRSPDHPNYYQPNLRQPIFIKLTQAGIDLIKNIEKDLMLYLLENSFNSIIGKNKPGIKPGSI